MCGYGRGHILFFPNWVEILNLDFIMHLHIKYCISISIVRHFIICFPAGSTLLTEAVTKTSQFTEIVTLLVNAGADLAVRDSLGNTPLHNSVMYFPSTARTVDLLLARGADVAIKNNLGNTPFHMSDDRDLKDVLKELKKIQKTAATATGRARRKLKGYSDSPKLRKLVFDLKSGETGQRCRY